jgi:hypothetical protein
MATTTFEEAKHCPKCGNVGEERSAVKLGSDHGVMHYLYCASQLCPWFDTPWMVQTLDDGSVPVREPDRSPQDFQPISADMKAMGRRYMEDILRRDLRGTDIDEGKG